MNIAYLAALLSMGLLIAALCAIILFELFKVVKKALEKEGLLSILKRAGAFITKILVYSWQHRLYLCQHLY